MRIWDIRRPEEPVLTFQTQHSTWWRPALPDGLLWPFTSRVRCYATVAEMRVLHGTWLPHDRTSLLTLSFDRTVHAYTIGV